MINVPKYNKENRKKSFEMLPKGAYVCKILNIEAKKSKKDQDMLKISFDIAEGEYKDFYMNQYKANKSENKDWSYDAVMYLLIPYDGCEAFVSQNWDTFWADVEDSNNGYVFTGDENSVKGKTFGGIFRIEQTEGKNGNVYDHTRLFKTRIAQDIRDGKVTKLPNDKLVKAAAPSPNDATADGFVDISSSAEDYPWK